MTTRKTLPTCEEQLEELRRKIRELEFVIAKNPAKLIVDAGGECLEVVGMKYALELFHQLGAFLPVGAVFEFVARGDSIAVRQITTELDLRRAVKSLEEREAKRAADFERLNSFHNWTPPT